MNGNPRHVLVKAHAINGIAENSGFKDIADPVRSQVKREAVCFHGIPGGKSKALNGIIITCLIHITVKGIGGGSETMHLNTDLCSIINNFTNIQSNGI